jgi:hypothetical protein
MELHNTRTLTQNSRPKQPTAKPRDTRGTRCTAHPSKGCAHGMPADLKPVLIDQCSTGGTAPPKQHPRGGAALLNRVHKPQQQNSGMTSPQHKTHGRDTDNKP